MQRPERNGVAHIGQGSPSLDVSFAGMAVSLGQITASSEGSPDDIFVHPIGSAYEITHKH